MLIAGSVLSMLLVGAAVDGFVNTSGEDGDDDFPSEDDLDADMSDQSGVSSTALSDLLFAGDDFDADDPVGFGASSDAIALSYTPIDQIEIDDDAELGGMEAALDSEWMTESAAAEGQDMLEVEALTQLQDGTDVSYIDGFDTETDSLVLDFDGTAEDAPMIEIDHTMEDGAAVVLANGIPVTLIEGAADMTPDHVRVVMSEAAIGDPELTEAVAPPDSVADGAPEAKAEDPAANNPVEASAASAAPGAPMDAHTAIEADNADPGTADDDDIASDTPELDEEDDNLFTDDGIDAGEGDTTDEAALAQPDIGDATDGDPQDTTSADAGLNQSQSDPLWSGGGDNAIIVDHDETQLGWDSATNEIIETAEVASNVTGFDPTEDRIEVLYDAQTTPDPVLEVHDFSDGSGADIVLNGEVILSVSGAQGLDPNMIDLRAVA